MQIPFIVAVVGVLTAGALDNSPHVGADDPPRRGTATSSDSVATYRGFYETGFEVSWFRPCNGERGDDLWWVTLTDNALRQRDSLAAKLPAGSGAVFVTWRGTKSAKLRAGHMGRGSRYMLVSEVLEVRPSTEAACTST